MIFLGMVGGVKGGGGGQRIAKPYGKSMLLIKPMAVLSDSEKQMLSAKQGLLKNAVGLGMFESATDIKQLGERVVMTAKQMFPNAASLLLARKQGDYAPVAMKDITFDPADLNPSAQNSIVRVAGELRPIERRTIYIPDIDKQDIYLACEFDEAVGGNLRPDVHEIEQGTIEESGLKMDLFSIKRAGIKSLAVSPVMEYQQLDPQGAIMLFGEPGFLHPIYDLIALRLLADQIARPLREKTS